MPTTILEPSPKSLGASLRHSREASGFTLKQVCETIGLGISTISDIESGKRRVSGIELYRFANLYNRSLHYFLAENETSPSFSLLFRAANEASVSQRTIIKFHELCRDYKALLKLNKAVVMPSPPDYSATKPISIDHAEELADAERGSLGLNGQPIRDIYDLLETKRGIRIFHLPEEPESFSGAFACDENLGPCFLINSTHPYRRRTFTVAHEYAHCIANRDQMAHVDISPTFQTRNPHERFANSFAAAFLMPRHSMSEVLGGLLTSQRIVTAEVIIRIALYFGVSFESVGWRLVSLRKLSRSTWDNLLNQQIPSSSTARVLGYTSDTIESDILPRHYKFLAYSAYKNNLISFERLAEFLRRNFFELREEFEQESQEGDA